MRSGLSPPSDSGQSCSSALGRDFPVRASGKCRPLCDSRQRNLRTRKLPFIRDGARFALRWAEVGLSRLGEGRRTGT